MIGFIIILLCIGALYQWRNTDFVKAIITTFVVVVGVISAFLVLSALSYTAVGVNRGQSHVYEFTSPEGVKYYGEGSSPEDAFRKLEAIRQRASPSPPSGTNTTP